MMPPSVTYIRALLSSIFLIIILLNSKLILGQESKSKTIVELGVHNGFSYFSFCQTVHDYKLKTKCFGIDHWQGDPHASFYDDKVYKEVL